MMIKGLYDVKSKGNVSLFYFYRHGSNSPSVDGSHCVAIFQFVSGVRAFEFFSTLSDGKIRVAGLVPYDLVTTTNFKLAFCARNENIFSTAMSTLETLDTKSNPTLLLPWPIRSVKNTSVMGTDEPDEHFE
jgi:hypothetical protein